MEVMLEIYRTLKALGMEWKEKKSLGGLGGIKPRQRNGMEGGARVERVREMDGCDSVDLRLAASVYFVETRARVQNVVVRSVLYFLAQVTMQLMLCQVLMNLQLYMVDSINYLVDFHHKRTYKASSEPGAGKFDEAKLNTFVPEGSSDRRSIKDKDHLALKEDEVVSPFVFMDVACRLILELAGGGE